MKKAAVVCAASLVFSTLALADGPIPIGTSTITVSYNTQAGPVSYSGDRDYSGTGPSDATNLDDSPNIRAFNSVNAFGRRTFLDAIPQYDHVIGENESALAHAFFKQNIAGDYFPDLLPGSSLTIAVEGIQFDSPVNVDDSTIMLHSLWNGAQADQLDPPYFNTHNHHTQTDPFRDFDDFVAGGVFSNFPTDNYALDTIDVSFTGEGTDTLDMLIEFPYSMLDHPENVGQKVPGGLPAPFGFLEPFHFHVEYVVTPEPGTLALLLPAVFMIRRKR